MHHKLTCEVFKKPCFTDPQVFPDWILISVFIMFLRTGFIALWLSVSDLVVISALLLSGWTETSTCDRQHFLLPFHEYLSFCLVVTNNLSGMFFFVCNWNENILHSDNKISRFSHFLWHFYKHIDINEEISSISDVITQRKHRTPHVCTDI